MKDGFRIYVDQLRDGHIEEISEEFPVDFLDIAEDELVFTGVVKVKGEAYLADDDLVLHLDAEAVAMLPCSICNEKVLLPIVLKGFYHAEPVKEIKGKVFDFSGVLRDALLLEVPQFTECNNGHCSHRADLASYLKNESPSSSKGEDEGERYHPFTNLSYPDEPQ